MNWCFLVIWGSLQAACNAKKGLHTLAEAKECFDTLKDDFNRSEMKQAIQIVRQYAEHYAYYHHARQVPSPLNQDQGNIDIDAQLKAVSNYVPHYSSLAAFHVDVAKILHQLRDDNFQYVAPCLTTWQYVFPYALRLDATDISNPVIKLEARDSYSATSTFEKEYKIEKTLKGSIIRKLSIYTRGNPKSSNPIDVLAKWADENLWLSKFSSNRFNNAIQGGFALRRANEWPMPDSVKVTVTLTGGSNTSVTIPFFALYTGSKEVTNLNDICPLIKKSNEQDATPLDDSPPPPLTPLFEDMESVDGHFDNSQIEQSVQNAMGNADVGAYTSLSSHAPSIQGGIFYTPNIGHLKIGSFAPTYQSSFGAVIARSFDVFRARKVEKLIIDVRQCTSGDANLAYQLLLTLWPSSFPTMPLVDSPSSAFTTNINTYYNKTNSYIIEPDTLERMVPSENVTKTFHNIYNNPYTVPFTKQYRHRLENTNVYYQFYHSFGHRPTDYSPLFKPENVIVLTDGLCLGTCGIFINQIKEKNLAKVVYCGGYPVKQPHLMSISSSIGGARRLNTADVAYIYKNLGMDYPYSSFLRTGTELYVPLSPIYSTLPNKNEVPWEYMQVPPDTTMPFYSPALFTADDFQKVSSAAEPELGQCASGQVQVTSKCRGDSSAPKYMQFGYVCTGGTWNTSQCASAGCRGGKYLPNAAATECVDVPNPYLYLPLQKLNFWIVVIIIVLSSMVVVVIVGGIFINLGCAKRRRKREDDGYAKQVNAI
ncbi:hypothetical protein BLNAU_18056 [Blattamonas nauphoetae]|uniref:Tail specific protease domain-containing protein n=1 Tax=Blattamonas nauphoetae TaxID=2049346 RepID=A0ABQ9X5K1_9EUKA|nr:hypothetical protein BLNAU_18056 [Blattamonas nauphoetae]